MKNKVIQGLIRGARGAYWRRKKALRGMGLQDANTELQTALAYLAQANLCEVPKLDRYGLVDLTAAQLKLLEETADA